MGQSRTCSINLDVKWIPSSRRSLVCPLYRGVGESAPLCLFDARRARPGRGGGGDRAGVGGEPRSLLARLAIDGGGEG